MTPQTQHADHDAALTHYRGIQGRLEDEAQEQQQHVEVLEMGRREAPAGFAARLTVGDRLLGVSRLDGEDGWTIDSEFVFSTLYPLHVNGYGSRCLRTETLSYGPAIDALREARMAWATGDGRR